MTVGLAINVIILGVVLPDNKMVDVGLYSRSQWAGSSHSHVLPDRHLKQKFISFKVVVNHICSAGTHMHGDRKRHLLQNPCDTPWVSDLGACVGDQSAWAWSWTCSTKTVRGFSRALGWSLCKDIPCRHALPPTIPPPYCSFEILKESLCQDRKEPFLVIFH